MPYILPSEQLDDALMAPLRNVKAVLFDVGGTLIKTDPPVAQAFEQFALQQGYQLNHEEILHHLVEMDDLYEVLYDEDDSFWCTYDASYQLWVRLYTFLARRLGIVGEDGKQLAQSMYEFYISPEGWAAYPEVLKTFQELQALGYRLGVISNWGSGLTEILSGLGLLSYFDIVVGSAAVGLKKPDKEIFLYAAQNLEINPQEIIFVGDHRHADVFGSAEAGMIPAHLLRSKREVGSGNPSPLETDQAVISLKNCFEVVELLKRVQGV